MRKLVKVVCVCCVAGVFSALACNFSKAPDDPQIVEAIKSQLFDHPELKSRNVSVASSEGVVTLSGQVKSQSERLRVEEIARQVPGVEEVRDSLEVVEDQPKAARATPAPPPRSRSQPRVGSVEIHTVPREAEVFINGKRRGVSPVKLNLPPGKFRMAVQKGGYEPFQGSFTIEQGKSVRKTIVLAPGIPGRARTLSE